MKNRIVAMSLLAGGAVITVASTSPNQLAEYTTDFGIDASHSLAADGANEYLSLKPGTFHRYAGEDDDLPVVVEVTVLDESAPIRFQANGEVITVVARIVEEREWIDRELVQVSRNYYASCSLTRNIYYLGEEVDHYQDGAIVSHEGSWMSGENGAQPGLRMPGFFLLGARYQQEMAPHVSMDQAEHISMGATVATPSGVFHDCIAVLETSPLDPDEETLKVYAPGVGLVLDGSLELVEFSN
jgi:hypothetical protein